MNILYIVNHLNTGGITSYLLTLATGMKRKGHEVTIASSSGEWLFRFTGADCNYVSIPIRTKNEFSPGILWSLLKLSKVVREGRIQLVHSHSRTTQVLASLLAQKTGVKHVFTCHGFFKQRLSRKLFPCWPDALIAISESVKDHLVKDLLADEKKIGVVHNGIDVEKFRAQGSKSKEACKKELGLAEGAVVGIVARLSEVKGHLTLIQAMHQVLESFPGAQLVIVGDGKMKEALVKAAKDFQMGRRVFFIPAVSDTREALAAMDVFVMPSLKEGLGLALMEAMAFGLPVIGSDVGGIKSLIQDGVNGLLVPPTDAEGLADCILRLLKDPGKASIMGRAAQTFIRENFSQEKMISQTEDVYSKCLNAG